MTHMPWPRRLLELGGGVWSHISQKWQQPGASFSPNPPQANTPVAKPVMAGKDDPWQALDLALGLRPFLSQFPEGQVPGCPFVRAELSTLRLETAQG